VTATASDNVAVASVQFQVDGTNLGAAVTTAPYSKSLSTTTLANGTHTLTAIATDTSNNKATSAAVSITVNNTSSTLPTVSITSPVSGATVSGTTTVTANASSSIGIASVQFKVDGANLGAAATTAPYQVSWDTTQASNGTHVLTAQAKDLSANTATSSSVSVDVSNSTTTPPPSAADTLTINDASGLGQTNRAVSVSRPFVEGEIPNYAQASINGAAVLTQCDVKNRWPDGSLKFAIVSFIVPSISANGSVTVTFANQTSGNNTGYLAKSDMLASSFNFDGQVQLTGAASHNISARGILNSAASCTDPGSDPDSSSSMCRYWLKGPIVTAIILEDRSSARTFDVNTDGGTGNPLHPIFEAWFYPQGNLVQLGYTLEDSWASSTPANSARDQSYSLVLTGGQTSPVSEFTNGSFTQITRSRWHRTFCVNGAGAGTANRCGPSLHIDNNWAYWAETKFLPHWDPNLVIAPSRIASQARSYTNANCGGSACSNAIQGNSNGVGQFQGALDSAGSTDWHGPLTTWDIMYLITQCDAGNSTSAKCGNGSNGDLLTDMLGSADLGGRIPYFYREADTSAGVGQFFDAPNNAVGTLGRVISINARTQISLDDVTNTIGQCGTQPADLINFGGSGQDLGAFNGQQDMSHAPNLAYASYLNTGQYAYYEEQLMESAYAIADTPGTRACASNPTQASLRQGAKGYWLIDGERDTAWIARENAIGAFIAVDGSPEKTYFTDKLNTNLAVWEGAHGIPCDITGTGLQEPYCGGSGQSTAWSYGNTVRRLDPLGSPGTTLGSWTQGLTAYVQNGPLNQSGANSPASANSNFQNAYSVYVLGFINDLGFCPNTNGQCQMLQFAENRLINVAMNPNANPFSLSNYVYPTLNNTGGQITTWTQNQTFYASQSTSWPDDCTDEGYTAENLAGLSFAYGMTSTGAFPGFSGASAYNNVRSGLMAACASGGNTFANASPKWDITPRQTNPPPAP